MRRAERRAWDVEVKIGEEGLRRGVREISCGGC